MVLALRNRKGVATRSLKVTARAGLSRNAAIVVDAKVPIDAYMKATEATSDADRERHLDAHVAALRIRHACAVRRDRAGRVAIAHHAALMRGEDVGERREVIDRLGRRIHDLRISVTDRCNFRCTYCMPAEGLAWLP